MDAFPIARLPPEARKKIYASISTSHHVLPIFHQEALSQVNRQLRHETLGLHFDINHFIGVSEYYYSAQDIFGLGGAYDYHTLSNAVASHCSRSWTGILQDLEHKKFPEGVKQGKLESVCFKAAWIMSVLHDGIGIPRVGKERISESAHNGTEELREGARKAGFDGAFNSAESLEGTEVSWTLGKVVLLAAADVQLPTTTTTTKSHAENLPIGFGPNLRPELFKAVGGTGSLDQSVVVPLTGGVGVNPYAHAGSAATGIFWQALFLLAAILAFGAFVLVRMRKLPIPALMAHCLGGSATSAASPSGYNSATGVASRIARDIWTRLYNGVRYLSSGGNRRKIMGARGETAYEYDSLPSATNNSGGIDYDVEIELGQATANAIPISRSQSSMRLSRRSSDT